MEPIPDVLLVRQPKLHIGEIRGTKGLFCVMHVDFDIQSSSEGVHNATMSQRRKTKGIDVVHSALGLGLNSRILAFIFGVVLFSGI